MKELLLLLAILILSIPVVSSETYQDCSIYGNCRDSIQSTFNNNTANVNNSDYLDGFTSSQFWRKSENDINITGTVNIGDSYISDGDGILTIHASQFEEEIMEIKLDAYNLVVGSTGEESSRLTFVTGGFNTGVLEFIDEDYFTLSDDLYSNNIHSGDNEKFYFGTSDDSEIYYDESDLIIEPNAVGTGDLIVKNGIEISDFAPYTSSIYSAYLIGQDAVIDEDHAITLRGGADAKGNIDIRKSGVISYNTRDLSGSRNFTIYEGKDSQTKVLEITGGDDIGNVYIYDDLYVDDNLTVNKNLVVGGCIVYNNSGTPVTLGDCI